MHPSSYCSAPLALLVAGVSHALSLPPTALRSSCCMRRHPSIHGSPLIPPRARERGEPNAVKQQNMSVLLSPYMLLRASFPDSVAGNVPHYFQPLKSSPCRPAARQGPAPGAGSPSPCASTSLTSKNIFGTCMMGYCRWFSLLRVSDDASTFESAAEIVF